MIYCIKTKKKLNIVYICDKCIVSVTLFILSISLVHYYYHHFVVIVVIVVLVLVVVVLVV